MNADPIYLDGYATMPMDPQVQLAILAAFSHTGNAGSMHAAGNKAAATIFDARAAVGDLIGAQPSEIVFTSGATEANNLAISGVAHWAKSTRNLRRRIVVSAIEHKAVLEAARETIRHGFEVAVAPVRRSGMVDLDALADLVDHRTLLVSVMAANNETGVIQPIAEASAIARRAGALFHCDAAQAVGKIPLNVLDLDIDYLSLSGHKFYGPMGIGALFISSLAPKPSPIHFGGGQQDGIRPGTEPVALIVGLGTAATVAAREMARDADHCARMADRLRSRLSERQVSFINTTKEAMTLPGSLSLMLTGAEGDDLVMHVGQNLCISTGSACSSGQVMPSHVLSAMGLDADDARSVIRIFCGRFNSEDEIKRAADLIADAFLHLRSRTGRLRQSGL